MTNDEILSLLEEETLVVSKLSSNEWRGFLFRLLKSHHSGEVLVMTRPLYEGRYWNESLAMSWLQILEGIKTIQKDWTVLTMRCPELLDETVMGRLYSPDALMKAEESTRYVAPDKESVGDVVLALMEKAIGPVNSNCVFCGTQDFVDLTGDSKKNKGGPYFCFPLK